MDWKLKKVTKNYVSFVEFREKRMNMMDIHAMSHFRDYLDLYQSKLSFPLLLLIFCDPEGIKYPKPCHGQLLHSNKKDYNWKQVFVAAFLFECDPEGIQTLDLQNRNLTLYSAKLRDLSGCKGNILNWELRMVDWKFWFVKRWREKTKWR